ncbi:MAG: hypothetical protein JW914_08120, partial [Syntrophaceae bacterium]|nr:hypothetical protein [Syntrophaceae bacterium]
TTFDALQAMHHFPHNSILLIEIANVLRARQMIDEADEVLSNLLLFDPAHIVARVMRMVIYSNIAQTQNDFLTSEMAFERAIAGGEFITSFQITDCNIWSEFGALYFNRAKKVIKFMRQGDLSSGQIFNKKNVLDCLDKAKTCFSKSLATSPTGKDTSAAFWLIYILCFIELFSADETLLNKSDNIMIVDSNNVFNKVGLRMFTALGWLKEDIPSNGNISESSFNNLLITLSRINARQDNSMLSRNYIPYVKFLFAMFLWDFTPYFTVEIYDTVLYLLNEARRETEKLIPDNICVYKICQNFVTPAEFLGHIKETEDLIKKLVTRDDFKQGDGLYLNPEKQKELSKIKLMLLELTRY